MRKPIFRVTFASTTYSYVDVEARDEEDAIAKAEPDNAKYDFSIDPEVRDVVRL